MTDDRRPAATSTFDRVLGDLGTSIVSGAVGPGVRRSIDDLVVSTGASRSIVREAVRVLVGLGLLDARRRVGTVVQSRDRWDVLDPLVVRWRLAGPERASALGELRALRRAVEPEAAAAAAERVARAVPKDGPAGGAGRVPDVAGTAGLEALLAAADRLAAATGPDGEAPFLQADLDLHRGVLELSGNALYARLHRVVGEALDVRAGIQPDVHDVGLHRALVDAIAAGDPDRAAAAMREIVDRT